MGGPPLKAVLGGMLNSDYLYQKHQSSSSFCFSSVRICCFCLVILLSSECTWVLTISKQNNLTFEDITLDFGIFHNFLKFS